MKRILLSATAAALIAGPAFAADMPIKVPPRAAPIYGWSGFYIGGGIGARGATIDNNVTAYTINGAPAGAFAAGACTPIPGGCFLGEPQDQVAFRGTIYGGYNWQVAPTWLVGIEGDVGFASRTRTLVGANYPMTAFAGANNLFGLTSLAGDTFAVKTGWDASLRGRLGWLWNPSVLLYVTGGVSWLRLEETSTCQVGNAGLLTPCTALAGAPGLTPLSITDKSTRAGGTIGGGLEAMLAPNWIARGEYRYASYGTATWTDVRVSTLANGGVPAGSPWAVTHNAKVQTQTATIGISYLWGGAAPIATRY